MSSELSFYQINAHHSKSATIEINNLTIKSQQFIILVQEPYIYNNQIKILNKHKFNIFSYIGPNKIRTCILTSKNCEVFTLRHLCTGDLTVVSLKIALQGCVRTMIIASCYLPSEENILPPSQELINLSDYCKSKNLPLIVGCDANSHHSAWGSSNCNIKGDSLLRVHLSL